MIHDTDIALRIGHNIADMRRTRGMSQQDLSDRCSEVLGLPVSVYRISRWERGLARLPVECLCVIATALECTTDRLCNFLPVEAINDVGAISDALARLSPEERSIVHYVFAEWKGPVSVLMHFMGLYTSLPDSYRVDTAGMLLQRYCEAQKAGKLVAGAPTSDIEAVANAWLRIARDRNWI